MTLQNNEISSFPKNFYLIRLLEKKKAFVSPNNQEELLEKSCSHENIGEVDENSQVSQSTTPNKTPSKFTPTQNKSGARPSIVDENTQLTGSTHASEDCSILSDDTDICKEHGRKLEIVCLDHKCRICTNCALFGAHKGHNVRPEEEVHREIAVRGDKLIDMFHAIEKQQNKINDPSFSNKMSEKIKDRYDEIANVVHDKFNVRRVE